MFGTAFLIAMVPLVWVLYTVLERGFKAVISPGWWSRSLAGVLPEGIRPQMTPPSSIMGQIVIAGMYVSPKVNVAPDERTDAMDLRTLAETGIRRAELVALDVRDIALGGAA